MIRSVRALPVVVAAVVLAVLSGVAAGPVGAQDAPATTVAGAVPPDAQVTPYPAKLFAPTRPGDAAELAVSDLYVAPGDDPASVDVAVRFAAPFTLPRPPYKVGVVIGDPGGARVRGLLTATGGTTPQGSFETDDGSGWRYVANTTVTFDPSGIAVVRMPTAKLPTAGVAWVEVSRSAAASDPSPAYVSDFVSRDALLGTGAPGVTPSATFGRTAVVGAGAAATPSSSSTSSSTSSSSTTMPGGGPEVGTSVDLGPGSSLTIGGGRLTVTSPGPVPTQVGPFPAQSVVDVVRIAPTFGPSPLATKELRIDRTAGSIDLYAGSAPGSANLSGDRRWLLDAQASAPGAAPTVVVDLAGLGAALDIDPATSAFGIARVVGVGGGREVVTGAVLGTGAWFDLVPATGPDATSTTAAEPIDVSASYRRSRTVVGGALALVALVAVAAAIVLMRRRRADRSSRPVEPPDDGGDSSWDGAAPATSRPAEDPDAPSVFERLRVTTSVPVVEETEAAPSDAGSPPDPGAPAAAAEPVEPVEARPRPAARGVSIAGEEVGVLASRRDDGDAGDEPAPADGAARGDVARGDVAREGAAPADDAPADDARADDALAVEAVPLDEAAPDDRGRDPDRVDPLSALAALDAEVDALRSGPGREPPDPASN